MHFGMCLTLHCLRHSPYVFQLGFPHYYVAVPKGFPVCLRLIEDFRMFWKTFKAFLSTKQGSIEKCIFKVKYFPRYICHHKSSKTRNVLVFMGLSSYILSKMPAQSFLTFTNIYWLARSSSRNLRRMNLYTKVW